MTTHCYALEANSIQTYIAAGGKLRDMVAASDLLAAFCSGPSSDMLADLLKQAGIEEAPADDQAPAPIAFSRRAGGAFRLFCDDAGKLQRLLDLVSLTLPQYAPGLAFTHAIGAGEDARAASYAATANMQACRNRHRQHLPAAGPLAMRCPRTGNAAITGSGDEAIDAELRRKRHWAKYGAAGLAERLVPHAEDAEDIDWPLQIEPQDAHLPAILDRDAHGAAAGIAVVHADGNGLGLLLIKLNDALSHAGVDTTSYAAALLGFSTALDDATQTAAVHACQQVLLPAARERGNVMPARPLVLGGDDLTFIVRADLALPFTQMFLEQFENAMRDRLAAWIETLPAKVRNAVPRKLTAAAGIAFVKPRMPYFQTATLAEQLCRQAKDAAATVTKEGEVKPSTLSFVRVTSSLIGEPDDLIGFTPIVRLDGKPRTVRLGLPTYALSSAQGLPTYDALVGMAAHLRHTVNEKPLRGLLNLMQSGVNAAQDDYRRWREMQTRSDRAWLDTWDQHLAKLGNMSADNTLPWLQLGNDWYSPLGDLLTLMGVAGDQQGESNHA